MTARRALWPVWAGMTVAGAAAITASASTLATLAAAAGWASWTPWLLPAALDVGGAVGGWCWLRPGAPTRAITMGRWIAITGATGTLVGNAVGHLVASGYVRPGPLLVVIVGAVPAAVLLALAHLAALLTAGEQPAAAPAAKVTAGEATEPTWGATAAEAPTTAPPPELERRDDAPTPVAPPTGVPADLETAAIAAAARIRAADPTRIQVSGEALYRELRAARVAVDKRKLPALRELVNRPDDLAGERVA